MSSLSKEAVMVHEALLARGLETPLRGRYWIGIRVSNVLPSI